MKKALSILLVLVLTLSLGTITAFAAPVDSNATVTLTPGALEVIDPPTTDPAYAGIKGKDIVFVTTQITGGPQSIAATEDVGVAVSDPRGLTNGNWAITLAMAGFKAAGVDSLDGASIALINDITSTVGPAGALPANKPAFTGNLTISKALGAVLLGDSADKTLGGSPGIWATNWAPTLAVLGGKATDDAHASVLTWTLAAGV